MHDCRATESRLVDLVFGELGERERLSLLEELRTCADCLGDYDSMTGALTAFDCAAEATTPDESFWPAHHAAILRRLDERDALAARKPASIWRRLLTTRLPVPVPAAFIIALALVATSLLALRPSAREAAASTSGPSASAQAPAVLQEPPRFVEVPVYRDRVLTRTVYVEKKARERNESRRKPSPAPRVDEQIAAGSRSSKDDESAQGGFFTRANLTDFHPSDEMKIRIVKRNNSDEN